MRFVYVLTTTAPLRLAGACNTKLLGEDQISLRFYNKNLSTLFGDAQGVVYVLQGLRAYCVYNVSWL